MGYLRPSAVIVSASYDRRQGEDGYEGPRKHWAEIAREAAVELLSRAERDYLGVDPTALVSPLSPEGWNGTRSFCVFWDGSKEGWEPSDLVDEALALFVAWLREQAYADGSSPLDWVWVRYGGDDRIVAALAHSGDRAREAV